MKTEVLSLILNRPNVRTVEIADRLDMEPERVRPLIADEIKRGIIVEETIIAPNGHPVLSFRYAAATPSAAVVSELPPQPFTPRVLRALPPTERPVIERERPLSSRPPAPVPPPAVDPLTLALAPARVADEPLEIDVPVTRKAAPLVAHHPSLPPPSIHRIKPKTRVDLGMDFLIAAAGKPVTNAELSKAMDLPTNHYPGSYLKFALKDGRVVRAGEGGKDWAAGSPSPSPKDPAAILAAVDLPELAPAQAATACGDCETVALLESALAESPAPAPVETGLDTPVEPTLDTPAVELVEHPAAQEAVITSETIAVLSGGLPNIRTPYLPPVAPGAPEIGRAGLYENGEFRKPAEELFVVEGMGVNGDVSEIPTIEPAPCSTAPAKLLAGIMSDGSTYLSVPGHPPMSLTPEQGRDLYLFFRQMGYAAWPKAA